MNQTKYMKRFPMLIAFVFMMGLAGKGQTIVRQAPPGFDSLPTPSHMEKSIRSAISPKQWAITEGLSFIRRRIIQKPKDIRYSISCMESVGMKKNGLTGVPRKSSWTIFMQKAKLLP